MFIEDDQLIDIKIHFRKYGHIYEAFTEQEYKELKLTPDDEKKYSAVCFSMKVLDWGTYNTLQESAVVEDVLTKERKFNYKLYKEARLKTLIKQWDAKDKENKPVPINMQTISKLAPSIGEAILRAYDEESFLTKDEEKNS